MSSAAMSFGVKSYDFFFDRDAVLTRLTKKEARVLSLTGLRGRDEIRRRVLPESKAGKKNSGKYPFFRAHRNAGLRFVLFAMDFHRGSVIIGPQKFSTETFVQGIQGGALYKTPHKPVPQLINEGGTSTFEYRYRSGKTYQRVVTYRAFPFVTDAEMPTLNRMRDLLQQIPL